jgi:hypothetical protein
MSDIAGLIVFKNVAGGDDFAAAEFEPAALDGQVDYLRAREQAERVAAKRAQSLAARQAHQELAQHYAQLVRRVG